MSCIKACLGVMMSCLSVFLDRKCDQEFWINLCFCIFACPLGILHHFAINDVDLLTNLLCLMCPPFAVYLMKRDCASVVINFVLCMLFFFPGIIHAYHIALSEKAKVA